MNREQAISEAHQWASFVNRGDPGICLYAFASTGRVQSEGHRKRCLGYIAYLSALKKPDPELLALASYIKAAPIEGESAHV